MQEYDFIEYIKRKRLSLFLTQKDLAKRIPISKTAYCKIENHQQSLSFFVLTRIASLLQIDLNIILDQEQSTSYFYD